MKPPKVQDVAVRAIAVKPTRRQGRKPCGSSGGFESSGSGSGSGSGSAGTAGGATGNSTGGSAGGGGGGVGTVSATTLATVSALAGDGGCVRVCSRGSSC